MKPGAGVISDARILQFCTQLFLAELGTHGWLYTQQYCCTMRLREFMLCCAAKSGIIMTVLCAATRDVRPLT